MTADMVKDMVNDFIVFALANPDPEIPYNVALKAREDVIMATGRSDHPNQVNNVLGFPYIFRGALDVRATCINDERKLAAVRAIAELAKESVPEEVNEAYDVQNIAFGRDLIIPKPLDPRLITAVASDVAKAAMESGVAKLKIEDWAKYKQDLSRRLGRDSKLIRNISVRAKKKPKRVVFAEADHYKILKAAEQALDEGIAHPILLGEHAVITEMIETNNINIDPDQVEIIDPRSDSERKRREEFEASLYALRQRKGMTQVEARKAVRDRNYFGAMLVHTGQADSLISGLTRNYRNVIRPAIQILGMEEDVKKVAGMYIVQSANGPIFFADTTVNMDPTAEAICDITLWVAKTVKRMQMTPRVAMLSYSRSEERRVGNVWRSRWWTYN